MYLDNAGSIVNVMDKLPRGIYIRHWQEPGRGLADFGPFGLEEKRRVTVKISWACTTLKLHCLFVLQPLSDQPNSHGNNQSPVHRYKNIELVLSLSLPTFQPIYFNEKMCSARLHMSCCHSKESDLCVCLQQSQSQLCTAVLSLPFSARK